jgi:hypothetical protein
MTAEGGGGAPRAAARHDLGVAVERDLSGSGRLARGGSTRFSTIRFRSTGLPAPAAGSAEDAAPPAPAADAGEEAPAPRPSAGRRLLRWLGLG